MQQMQLKRRLEGTLREKNLPSRANTTDATKKKTPKKTLMRHYCDINKSITARKQLPPTRISGRRSCLAETRHILQVSTFSLVILPFGDRHWK